MKERSIRLLGIFTLGFAAVLPALAMGQPAPHSPHPGAGQCFRLSDWAGWTVTPDGHSMFLSVRRDVYRLDFAGGCPQLKWPRTHPVLKLRGGEWICGPLDFDMRVSDGTGIPSACIVSKMTRLSPEEAASLPKNLRP